MARRKLNSSWDLTKDDISPIESQVKADSARMPLDEIADRFHAIEDRPYSEDWAQELAESIEAIGFLLEPIVVDSKGRLIAGLHRRGACRLLRDQNPDRFAVIFPDGIPVNRLSVDSSTLTIEALTSLIVTENDKRLNYTPAQIKAVAERLLQAGYSQSKGRPAKGQKERLLLPALSTIFRVSNRTIQRYLATEEAVDPSGQENTTPVAFSEERTLKKLKPLLEQWVENNPEPEGRDRKKLTKLAGDMLVAIEKIDE